MTTTAAYSSLPTADLRSISFEHLTPAQRAQLRGVIYRRISDDRTDDEGGITRQLKDCKAKAAGDGVPIVNDYPDNNRSATIGVRPMYRELLADIEAGKIDVIYVWASDRLYRMLADLTELTAILLKCPWVIIRTVKSGDVDLSNADGILKAQLLGAVGEHESRKKGERVRAAAIERAKAGKFPGGMRRFGYNESMTDIEVHEAAGLRWAYNLIRNGGTLYAAAKHMGTPGVFAPEGLRGTEGAEISPNMIKDWLLRGFYAGHATYKGEVVGTGRWPAIIDEETYLEVRAILTDPSRNSVIGRPANTLLAPLFRCLVCGRKTTSKQNKGRLMYGCRKGCTYRHRDAMDTMVVETVLRLIEANAAELTREVVTPDADLTDVAERAQRLRTKRDVYRSQWEEDEITEVEYRDAIRKINAKITALESQMIVATGRRAAAVLVTAEDVRATWAGMSIPTQTETLKELIDRIEMDHIGMGKRDISQMHNVEIVWQDWVAQVTAA